MAALELERFEAFVEDQRQGECSEASGDNPEVRPSTAGEWSDSEAEDGVD